VARAPGELEKVARFVNTWDEEPQIEELPDPATLKAFFVEHELWLGGTEPGPADLKRAIELREALRALLRHNHGEPLDKGALKTVNRHAEAGRYSLHFTGDDSHLDPQVDGTQGALARLLVIVSDAMAAGNWNRLKICQNDDCAVAFYDEARNRSGKWCSMAVCGNRMKARTYRARHEGASA
jgi:predicted RNA-binding Zn ribbon-like protein